MRDAKQQLWRRGPHPSKAGNVATAREFILGIYIIPHLDVATATSDILVWKQRYSPIFF